jgi:uncharacterized membrane protein
MIMKKLRISATITTILGALSGIALILMFLALSDIADPTEPVKTEWRVVGICMIVLSAFVVSTFVTIGFLLKSLRLTDSISVTANTEID